ncbi:MAG TPA: 2-oxo-4-hydroxy-4-carboxy-5-ureidoimidazoline decarboxylase [Candidatus Dormibacteraeota bacterium]
MISIEEALEGSTPLAVKVRALGPFESGKALIETMREVAGTLSDPEKVATLNAHPRIGERVSQMSARSRSEQGDESAPELDELNADYERRFGFRFVTFVNRRPKSAIVPELRERLTRSRQEELNAGLRAVIDIAEDRLRR